MDAKELYVATCMVLSDWPKETVDAIFFHARGGNDFDGLFELAARMIKEKKARNVAINGYRGVTKKAESNYCAPDSSFYIANLIKYGVASSCIVLSQSSFHTKEENENFFKLAKENSWKSAVVLAQSHQILREFLGAIDTMTKINYRLRLYSVYPKSTLWWKKVFGSCTVSESMERFDHILEELERISRYQEKGDLCTFQEFIEYIRSRDKIP